MATLQSPTARWPSCSSARVTMPTGFVKSTIQASGLACARTVSATRSTTGTVRSAFAKPPGPVVSWPMQPHSCGNVSSPWRAAWPPTRSWISTASASDTPATRSLGRHDAPGVPRGAEHPLAHPADEPQPLGVGVDEPQLLDGQHVAHAGEPVDEFGGVGGASTDDSEFHGYPFTPVSVMPSTKTRWAKKKMRTTGTVTRMVIVIVSPQSVPCTPRNDARP